MKTSKIQTGAKVNGSKGQGTITRIITKSSGYVEVTYDNGLVKKEMAFNLTDENGESLKKAPKKQTEEKGQLTPAQIINSWKNVALSVNDKWNSNSTWKLAEDRFGSLDSKGNSFIDSLLTSMFSKNFLSEKQAFCLAKFAVETKQLS